MLLGIIFELKFALFIVQLCKCTFVFIIVLIFILIEVAVIRFQEAAIALLGFTGNYVCAHVCVCLQTELNAAKELLNSGFINKAKYKKMTGRILGLFGFGDSDDDQNGGDDDNGGEEEEEEEEEEEGGGE